MQQFWFQCCIVLWLPTIFGQSLKSIKKISNLWKDLNLVNFFIKIKMIFMFYSAFGEIFEYFHRPAERELKKINHPNII